MRKLFDLVGKITVDGIDTLNKNLTNITKTAESVVKPLARMGNQMSRLGTQMTRNLTVPLAAAGVAIYKGIDAASDLAETVSKVSQIFGDSSGVIDEWSNTTGKSIGQSKQQAMDAAATFAIFGKSAGMSGKDLSAFSIQFSELASDLASFHNTKPEEAITAIGAAMRGENEPMRRYGVLLDDASMRQKALELGIISTIKNALTPQQKVLAAQALILEQTKDAQGDFAKTQYGLANQTRIWKAEVADLTAKLGKSFLPIALDVTKIFREKLLPSIEKLVDWWNNLPKGVQETVVKLAAFVAIAGPAILLLGQIVSSVSMITTVLKTAQVALTAFNAVFAATPVGITALAFGSLAVAIWQAVDAYNNLKKAKENHARAAEITAINNEVIELIKMKQTYENLGKAQEEYRKAGDLNFDPEKVSFYREEIEKILSRIKTLNAEVNPNAAAAAEAAALAESTAAAKAAADAKANAAAAAKNAALTANDEQKKSDQALFEERIKLEKEWTDKVYEQTDSRLDILNRQETEAINNFGKSEELRFLITEYYSNERKILLDEEIENERQKNIERTENDIKEAERANLAKQIADQKVNDKKDADEELTKEIAINTVQGLFSAWADFSHNRIQQIDNELKANIAAIETSKMTAEEKEKAILDLQTKADKKKRDLQRKAAIAEKAGAIFSIVLSTAQAIMKAVGQLGPIVGGIAGVAMGLLGAAQVALVASKPIPLAKGGLIKKRKGGINTIIGEGDQDELVLPLHTGIDLIANKFYEKLKLVELPNFSMRANQGSSFAETNNNSSSRLQDIHLHIGTFIGDDLGIKRLEQKLKGFRLLENSRISASNI